ncbi:hypothetical protein SAMD00019534_041140 [Acytostelium subglobosum LB1]|uniref:hypothetical protein n=1 Tax=Acytostelium subglobosum LB1 TaxID=1410327 RepID=UPI000644D0AA|nr:hypothetical protein SAMD00019534_041140 [Acytostelium subglobosum LB1]GAM20939.1 hypothetical protein SAMD00019534_041140 [Acytostelium subglobosum LB1]|eukprot:XP_012756073.1 hypothetical protein SAMD00019534_041140 [Acytostelium subglobosum LB1]
MPSFVLVYLDPSQRAGGDIRFSQESSRLLTAGASMATNNVHDILHVMGAMRTTMRVSGKYSCPMCREGGLATQLDSEDIKEHIFLFHPSEDFNEIAKKIPKCPICKEQPARIGFHLFNDHAPPGAHNEKEMSLSTVYPFCLVVVRRRRDGRFLLVHEVAKMGWWLPGGRVNIGESLQTAAVRETKEEAGIDVEIKGILRFEYSPHRGYSRLRLIFYGEPVDDDQLPKTVPDYESLGAAYVSADDLSTLQLRGKEPSIWFNYVHNGGVIHPIDMLSLENAKPSMPTVVPK